MDRSDVRGGGRRGKLLDPQREFGSVRVKLNNILFDEYTGGVNNLRIILDWADQMRQNKVEETPLLNLIGRLQSRKKHHLIPPLYNAYGVRLGEECALYLYRAFRESLERKSFAGRDHIFFPWMIEVLNEKKLNNRPNEAWAAILDKLIEMDLNKLLPNFLRERLHSEIGNLFNYACQKGNFNIAQNVWDYCTITEISHRCSVYSLFLFTLYHWMNGRKKTAKTIASVLQSRIRFLQKASKNKKIGKD
uniref:Uncharacterized protein n=1 Tax=Meloidogyne hapla TaxID=6305 RepID=A0A1I8BCG3_MELHA